MVQTPTRVIGLVSHKFGRQLVICGDPGPSTPEHHLLSATRLACAVKRDSLLARADTSTLGSPPPGGIGTGSTRGSRADERPVTELAQELGMPSRERPNTSIQTESRF